MYVKLFTSIYQGTLRGKSNCLLVFTNLLAHADAYGIVDVHPRAIAEEVGLTVEQVRTALVELESPDPESRSPEEDGRRIVLTDEHRAWGWRIVNYVKYRSIRSEEERREQNRLAQERFRNKSKPPSATVSQAKPRSAHAEADAEEDLKAEREAQSAHTLPPKYLEHIKTNRPELDANFVWGKFVEHKQEKQRTMTAWKNWVASEVAPIHAVTVPSKPGRDPALAKLDADAANAAAPSAELLGKLAGLKSAIVEKAIGHNTNQG